MGLQNTLPPQTFIAIYYVYLTLKHPRNKLFQYQKTLTSLEASHITT